jgi:putative oxidoreductase
MAIAAEPIPVRASRAYFDLAHHLDRLQPLWALAIRFYVAQVFFASGLTKIAHWEITRTLFENEYHVPVLSPAAAAFLGTSAELGLPVLLALGLGTRAVALALFAFNIVAVVSYPELSDAGYKDHVLWGALLLATAIQGPGRLSIDAWIARRWTRAGRA